MRRWDARTLVAFEQMKGWIRLRMRAHNRIAEQPKGDAECDAADARAGECAVILAEIDRLCAAGSDDEPEGT
jgi:hypothetical protein